MEGSTACRLFDRWDRISMPGCMKPLQTVRVEAGRIAGHEQEPSEMARGPGDNDGPRELFEGERVCGEAASRTRTRPNSAEARITMMAWLTSAGEALLSAAGTPLERKACPHEPAGLSAALFAGEASPPAKLPLRSAACFAIQDVRSRCRQGNPIAASPRNANNYRCNSVLASHRSGRSLRLALVDILAGPGVNLAEKVTTRSVREVHAAR